VNSFLRFVACLIVLGASFGVGLLIFPAAEQRQVLAQTEMPDTPSLACRLKTWLHLDRDCAARSEPRPEPSPVAADNNPNPAPPSAPPADVAAAAKPPVPMLSAGLPREALQPTPITPPEREAAAQLPQQQFAVEQPVAQPPAPMAQAPAPTPQPPAVAAKAVAPRLPVERHPVERHVVERHAAERRTAEQPEAKEPTPAPAKKKFARREPAAKRPASEALRTVRKFDDRLQDIPVDAYAADGSRRSIVIRPTSIQDVYYYSVPR
jgi:hypothetical protein